MRCDYSAQTTQPKCTLAAFVSAFLCVRWLLRYISSHDFTFFAWYRIVFGVLVIASAHYGWVVWAE